MAFIDEIKKKARAVRKTIVLPESMDRRTWEAVETILKEDIADVVVLGTPAFLLCLISTCRAVVFIITHINLLFFLNYTPSGYLWV